MSPTLRPKPDDMPADAADEVARSRRIDVVDAARGLALLGMVAFHLDWDLAHFGYVSIPPMASSAWTALGHSVAATFLTLSGVGLVLARDRGLPHALGRIARIAGWAAAVTIVTAWLFPQEAVTFGILHCIAATNLIALAALRVRVGIVLAAAVAAVLAPALLTTGATEGIPWWWLGISTTVPQTLDYRPILPWLGLPLAGIVVARVLPIRSLPALPRLWTGLILAGRHSMVIYLVHQPILFGVLWLVSPTPIEGAGVFLPACQSECQAAGAGPDACRAACNCAAQQLVTSPPETVARDSPVDIAGRCVTKER